MSKYEDSERTDGIGFRENQTHNLNVAKVL